MLIDVHSHIIPSIDDGSRNINESIQMIQSEIAQGINAIICTPHSDSLDIESNHNTIKKFMDEIKKIDLGIYLAIGCEVFCSSDIIQSNINKLRTGIYYSMNNTQYVLTEYLPYASQNEIQYCSEMLINNGYIPILAHAERYSNLTSILNKLLDYGCLIQINAYSLVEEKDKKIKSNARELLESNCVSFIGSDAHRLDHRAPNLQSGIEFIRNASINSKYIDAILFQNAKNLLLGGDSNVLQLSC